MERSHLAEHRTDARGIVFAISDVTRAFMQDDRRVKAELRASTLAASHQHEPRRAELEATLPALEVPAEVSR